VRKGPGLLADLVDHAAGREAAWPEHMVPGEAFDLEEVRGLEEVHIAQELAVEEDLVAEAET
jgi:hypothetical protein